MAQDEIIKIFEKYLEHQEGKTEYFEVSREDFLAAIKTTIGIMEQQTKNSLD